jgi:TolA-binding protein
LRLALSTLLLCACACAGTQRRADGELEELRVQIAAQSAQIAAQQRRLEELEVKLAAVAAKADQPQFKTTPAAQPAPAAEKPPAKDPRPQLKTVKVGEGRRRIRDYNPVERAPALPSNIPLKEPDGDALARLEEAAVDPGIRAELDADHAFAHAVGKLNNGDLQTAETELLAFAGQHPRHTAADNALYLAGLIREHNGDYAGAVALFEKVPLQYPAGDAVLSSLLEKGRCLEALERRSEARELFARIVKEHPDGIEAGSARQLLKNLDDSESRRQ